MRRAKRIAAKTSALGLWRHRGNSFRYYTNCWRGRGHVHGESWWDFMYMDTWWEFLPAPPYRKANGGEGEVQTCRKTNEEEPGRASNGRTSWTVSNSITNRILTARDKRMYTGVCLLDMSKAFDKVRHHQLILDLFNVGVTATALRWFISYLSERTQRVCIGPSRGRHVVDTLLILFWHVTPSTVCFVPMPLGKRRCRVRQRRLSRTLNSWELYDVDLTARTTARRPLSVPLTGRRTAEVDEVERGGPFSVPHTAKCHWWIPFAPGTTPY